MTRTLGPYAYQDGVPDGFVRCCDDTHFGLLPGSAFMTEINPPGGYGRPQMLICDACMRSGRWDDWKHGHWANWPIKPRQVNS